MGKTLVEYYMDSVAAIAGFALGVSFVVVNLTIDLSGRLSEYLTDAQAVLGLRGLGVIIAICSAGSMFGTIWNFNNE